MERLGRYTLLRELGQGSRGQVFLARDPVIERDVVLKTLRTELAGNQDEARELLERFAREAKALGKLKHAAIVTIYDVGTDETTGVPYLAMEYVPGADLQSVTRSGMTLPVGQVADIGAQVAVTLDYAHRAGIIHRDVKPSNLILGVDGRVRVADFGIVKLQGADITQEGMTLGTPNYMSPEQIKGEIVDGRSDIFALGIVLYELLTGKKPFGTGHAGEVARRVLKDHPVQPSSLRARVPRDLSSFVMKCLEKEPDDRWARALELHDSLAAVAQREKARGDGETAVRIAVNGAEEVAPTSTEFLEGESEPEPEAAPGEPEAEIEPDGLPAASESGDGESDPVDYSEWVADKELVPAEQYVAPNPLPARWLTGAVLAVAVLGLLAMVVYGAEPGFRAFYPEETTYVFGVDPAELGEPGEEPTFESLLIEDRDIETRLEMAQADLDAFRYDDAIVRLESVLALSPGHEQALSLLQTARQRRSAR